jgi:class 3 adenylate cyclase
MFALAGFDRPSKFEFPPVAAQVTGQECTLLMTDIVESTELLVAVGDERWVRIRTLHDRRLRSCIARHDGLYFAHTGDGAAAAFQSVASALECALAIQRAFARIRAHSRLKLHLRVGVTHGRALPIDDGGLTGLAVHEVARVAALAHADEIVITDATRRRAGPVAQLEPLGAFRLKGFAAETTLFRLRSSVAVASWPARHTGG